MATAAIKVENLSKRYEITVGKIRHDTLYDQIAHGMKTLFRRGGRLETTSFWALRDVSFEVGRGEIIGIVGHNGAGKSTLLKLLSRITEPTRGRAEIRGRVGSLLEVGTGFHPELTGRENIFLNGAIIGMSKEEIRSHFDAIVAFAEVEKFIDVPVKRYSSGMYVRLAFAVSAHLRPDILMIDEVLSVGDLQFQQKCLAYAEELRKSNATILFVSHNMFSIKAMCQRAIFLSQGELRFDGLAADAIERYENEHRVSELAWAKKAIGADQSQWDVSITDVGTFDEGWHERNLFDHGERMRIRLSFTVRRPIATPNFLVSFIRSDDVACCNFNTAMDGFPVPPLREDGTIDLLTPPLRLVADSYRICVLVRDTKFERLYCAQTGKTFHIRHHLLNNHFGVFHEQGEWSMRQTVADRERGAVWGGLTPW